MEDAEILRFVKKNIEPCEDFGVGSPQYRASATLVDGLHLPCVVIKSRRAWANLAMRRFGECRAAKPSVLRRVIQKLRPEPKNLLMDYSTVVESFVCSGNSINSYDIQSLDQSPYVIPRRLAQDIDGETSMGWTQFSGTMSDGRQFEFGTNYHIEFFNMPEGYCANDMVMVTPAAPGGRPTPAQTVYRERPFFKCYIDGF